MPDADPFQGNIIFKELDLCAQGYFLPGAFIRKVPHDL